MTRKINRAALSDALEALKELPFPGHPDDPDLAEWVLELTELDGHVVGLATSALSSARTDPVHSAAAAQHQEWLERMGAVGDDEATYDDCRDYIRKLVMIEDLLAGRTGRHGEV
jgi:hypothetical protein